MPIDDNASARAGPTPLMDWSDVERKNEFTIGKIRKVSLLGKIYLKELMN